MGLPVATNGSHLLRQSKQHGWQSMSPNLLSPGRVNRDTACLQSGVNYAGHPYHYFDNPCPRRDHGGSYEPPRSFALGSVEFLIHFFLISFLAYFGVFGLVKVKWPLIHPVATHECSATHEQLKRTATKQLQRQIATLALLKQCPRLPYID